MYTKCMYMSLDDMEAQETDALNKKAKGLSVGDDVAFSDDSVNRNLSWRNALKQSLASAIAYSLVIQAGINMAYSAVLLPQLSADDTDVNITLSESTWIASIVTIALPPGSLAVGPLMDKFGRKKICMLTAIPFMCSWLIQSQATQVWHMYLARILAGIAGGLSTVSTVYVSEITHPNFRPMLLSLNSVFVSFGILITCIFGCFFNWRTMALIYCGMSAVSFCLLIFVPESPHWLLTFKDDVSRAAKSLKWTYPNPKVFAAQYDLFIESRHKNRLTTPRECEDDSDVNSKIQKIQNYLRTYLEPVIYKPVVILFLLFLFQQFSGAYVIIFYAVDIFRKLGGEFQKGIDAFVALVLLGSIRFFMSIVSTVLSKKIGRRPLLLTSGIGMAFTSLMAGLYMYLRATNVKLVNFHLVEDGDEDNVTLICVLGYVSFSAVGFLVIPWTLIGELLPTKVRGILSGFLVAIAYIMMFTVVKVFPYVLEWLNIQNIFLGMGVVNVMAVCVIYFVLPETCGKTFSEIEKYFKRR